MKKIKIGPSVIFLIFLCLFFNKILIMFNYLLALFLHEMAHLFVASKRGYTLKQFKFDIFGMSLNLNDDISDKDSFAINIAGPLLNLFICLLCMALYWLVPALYNYLNVFCYANLFLAIFNLLPIYPLDGGKIFRGFIKTDKKYRIFDAIIRYSFATIFLILFIISVFHIINWFYLIMLIFFLSSCPNNKPTLSIFKHMSKKSIEKVIILKVDENKNLYDLIKIIKRNHYTIFYCNTKEQKYIDEDFIIEKAISNPLTTKLKDL